MVDGRVASFALALALLAYAALAARRSSRAAGSTPDLGGAPPVIELEIRERTGARRLRSARDVLIGRSPSAAIKLADPTVSRVHARIARRDGSVYAEDLGSRNGTLMNGKPLLRAALLSPGDRVRVGSTDIVFVGIGEWK